MLVGELLVIGERTVAALRISRSTMVWAKIERFLQRPVRCSSRCEMHEGNCRRGNRPTAWQSGIADRLWGDGIVDAPPLTTTHLDGVAIRTRLRSSKVTSIRILLSLKHPPSVKMTTQRIWGTVYGWVWVSFTWFPSLIYLDVIHLLRIQDKIHKNI